MGVVRGMMVPVTAPVDGDDCEVIVGFGVASVYTSVPGLANSTANRSVDAHAR